MQEPEAGVTEGEAAAPQGHVTEARRGTAPKEEGSPACMAPELKYRQPWEALGPEAMESPARGPGGGIGARGGGEVGSRATGARSEHELQTSAGQLRHHPRTWAVSWSI